MNAKELRSKSETELSDELIALRKAQFSLRIQLRTQQLTNSAEIRKVRRDIARVKTVLNQKARSQ